jgi:hypothetical protein
MVREITRGGFGAKMQELNSKARLEQWRGKWEHMVNRHLERFGHEARSDHCSLEAQGIEREPRSHVGTTATDFEREGVETERGNINRESKERSHLKDAHRTEQSDGGGLRPMQSDEHRQLQELATREQQQADSVEGQEPGQEISDIRRSFWQERKNLMDEPREQAPEEKRARTEQIEYQQRKAGRDAMREQFDTRQGPAQSYEEQGRERERERN